METARQVHSNQLALGTAAATCRSPAPARLPIVLSIILPAFLTWNPTLPLILPKCTPAGASMSARDFLPGHGLSCVTWSSGRVPYACALAARLMGLYFFCTKEQSTKTTPVLVECCVDSPRLCLENASTFYVASSTFSCGIDYCGDTFPPVPGFQVRISATLGSIVINCTPEARSSWNPERLTPCVPKVHSNLGCERQGRFPKWPLRELRLEMRKDAFLKPKRIN